MASLMSFYAMFLLYNAMSSEKTLDCNPYYKSDSGSKWLGIMFTLITLCYSAMKADLLGGAVDMSGVSCCGCCPGYDNTNRKDSIFLESVNNGNNGNGNNGGNNNNESNYDENAGVSDGSNYEEKVKKQNEVTVKLTGDATAASKASGDDDDDDDKPKLSKRQKKKNTIYFHLIMMLASCYMAMLFTDWGASTDGIETTGMMTAWANMGCQWASMLLFWQTLAIYRRENRNTEE